MTDRNAILLIEARRDLAAAFRLAVKNGFHEGVCNHFSLAVPGSNDRFLLNPYGLHWSEMQASRLLVVDGEGQVVEGAGVAEATAFFIHSRIHRGAPGAACVLHTHMPFATALTQVVGGRLEPSGQNALRFHGRIAYDDQYNGLVLDQAEGDRLVAALGRARVMFLANHGVIVVGDSVARAFDDLYYLERACQTQVLAMSTGLPLRLVSQKIAEQTSRQIAADTQSAPTHFAALRRLLDAADPSYAA